MSIKNLLIGLFLTAAISCGELVDKGSIDSIDRSGAEFSNDDSEVTETSGVSDKTSEISFDTVADFSIDIDQTSPVISFVLNKGESSKESDALEFIAKSSNESLIESSSISIECTAKKDKCSGIISFSPVAGSYGESKITITANLGQATTSISFDFLISLNPQAVDDNITSLANQDLILNIKTDLLDNDSVLGGVDLKFVSFDAPNNGSSLVNNNDGTLTLKPTLDFVGLETFKYTISDGTPKGIVNGFVKIDILAFFDDFSRSNNIALAVVGDGWTEVETAAAPISTISLNNGSLLFTSANAVDAPSASHTFTKITDGKLVWKFDLNWQRDIENVWAVYMRLGKDGGGNAVNLVWGGGTVDGVAFAATSTFGSLKAGAFSTHGDPVDAPSTPIKVVVDIANKTYELTIGNTAYPNIPYDDDVEIDRLSFFATGAKTTNFLSSSFDNVSVGKLP
jgi:hypothetical protein